MRHLSVVLLAGCSFSTSVTAEPTDAASDDAAVDAPTEAALLPSCAVGVTTTPGTDRGRVGGNGGGSNFGPIRCTTTTDRIVGIGLRMSDGNTLYNARSAHALLIACAPVTIDPNTGTGTTGTVYTVEVSGSGAEGWSPSTLTPITTCPAGMVLDGLQTHTGPNANLFNNVNFRCARLDGTTAQTVANQVVHAAGSLTETQGTITVNCRANEVVYEMSNMTGSGFDSVNLFCAPAACL